MIIPGMTVAGKMMMGSGGFDPSTPLGTFIEGGYYLGTIVDASVTYALIVAPKATGQSPSNLDWGGSGITTGLTSRTDGFGNTAALVASATTYAAAEYCAGLSIGGFVDWYLPAVGELVVVHANRASFPSGEDYTNNYHWSSTENGGTSSVRFLFTNGAESNIGKTTNLIVRAIRRVEI